MTVERRLHLRSHHPADAVLQAPALSSTSAYPFDAAPFWWLWKAQQWHRASPVALRRRTVTLALAAWLPLVLLTAQQRGAGEWAHWLEPLTDIRIISRYLLALPILVLAEPLFISRLAGIVMHFQRAGFVRRADHTRFTRILARTHALLLQHFVEVVIVLLAFTISLRLLSAGAEPWELQSVSENPRLSSNAQWWLAIVSQPLFLIYVARWCWRSLVWFRTLRCIARLDLNMVPAHPDRAGGLLFVAQSIPALAPFGFALACALAGAIAGSTSVVHLSLSILLAAAGTLLAFLLVIAIGPLCWLSTPMRAAQLRGIVEYGELAARVGRRFEARWLRERRFVTSEALSASDFSATIDLYSVVSTVYTVRIIPVKARSLFKLVAATMLPFLPLLLMIVPTQDLMQFVAKLLL
jgi:hypothetical protein